MAKFLLLMCLRCFTQKYSNWWEIFLVISSIWLNAAK